MIAVFVTLKIQPEFRDQFLEATFGDARGSIRDEPRCYRFDVLQDSSDKNKFHLYEVYEDLDARDSHRRSPHFLEWWTTVENWFDGDIQRTMCETIFPSDAGWRSQKEHLTE